MVEDLRKLISFQNLSEGGGTPLMKFRGTLLGYSVREEYGKTVVDFAFAELEPDSIVSKTPYNFPTAVVPIKFSKKKSSAWGILALSVRDILGDEAEVDDLINKPQTWMKTPNHEFGKDKDGNVIKADIFEVVEVDGVVSDRDDLVLNEEPEEVEEEPPAPAPKPAVKAAVKPAVPQVPKVGAKAAPSKAAATVKKVGLKQSAREAAIDLLDGKSAPQFFQEAFTNEVIKTDSSVLAEIASGSFITTLLNSGEITEVDSIYHKA